VLIGTVFVPSVGIRIMTCSTSVACTMKGLLNVNLFYSILFYSNLQLDKSGKVYSSIRNPYFQMPFLRLFIRHWPSSPFISDIRITLYWATNCFSSYFIKYSPHRKRFQVKVTDLNETCIYILQHFSDLFCFERNYNISIWTSNDKINSRENYTAETQYQISSRYV
jgi:hypothetical protein